MYKYFFKTANYNNNFLKKKKHIIYVKFLEIKDFNKFNINYIHLYKWKYICINVYKKFL